MTASVAEHVSQQPGPMVNAKAVPNPINNNITKKRHWLSVWQADPSLNLAAQATQNPINCAETSNQNTAGESSPFMGGRILSVWRDDNPSQMIQE
jgi:hypothetical protein